ncbi:MAG: ShlB/FhaC/HecB family hemolysin secretion/activation protein [Kiritimatiellae bacterium]|nr:ShlB/FhaC/HecB family hemolysin secretion/activation protein [Kiritimatiellia bacterium]
MKRKTLPAIVCLLAALGASPVPAGQPAAAAAAAVGGRIASDGQVEQMKSMSCPPERTIREQEKGREKAAKAMTVNGRKAPAPKAQPVPPAGSTGAWKAGKVEVAAGAWNDDPSAAGFAEKAAATVSADGAEALRGAFEKHFRDNGYYLCHVAATATNEAAKTVDFKVNYGHIRAVTISFREQSWLSKAVSTNEAAPDGRWFSKEQIRYRYLKQVASSNVFNYATLYDRFYQMNSHPDLTAQISLSVPDKDGQGHDVYPADDDRALDVSVEVRERLPLHFVFDVDNNGTDASENWMGRLTAQYLNLTKHDDVLTLNYQNSLSDIDALGGLAASYYLPHTFGTRRDFALTLYGGWTDVDSEDVVPGIDVVGSGWFAGLQESATVLENELRSLRVSAGLVRRYVKDHLEVKSGSDRYRLEENEVTVMPFSFAVMYSEKKPDRFNGLNFATVETLYNAGGFLGTSDRDEMELQRTAADENYLIVRAQMARLQLLSLAEKPSGSPMLFAKVGGQWAGGALIPAEQMGLGGDGSVRGYATREYLGDHGIAGTLELRTPIALGFFSRKVPSWFGAAPASAGRTGADDTPFDRLQFVLFADAGCIKIEDPLPGEESSKTLLSAGFGVRLALSDHFQVKCDVGFPLEETTDSDTACVHFSSQVQF